MMMMMMVLYFCNGGRAKEQGAWGRERTRLTRYGCGVAVAASTSRRVAAAHVAFPLVV